MGSSDDVRRLVGEGTRVIDAGGRTVVPGLIDSHVHALGVAEAEAAQPFQNLQVRRRDPGLVPPARRPRPGRVDLDAARLPHATRRAPLPDSRGARCCGARSSGGGGRRLRADGQQRGASRGGIEPARRILLAGPSSRASMAARPACCGMSAALLARFRPRGRDPRRPRRARARAPAYNRVGITSVVERGATWRDSGPTRPCARRAASTCGRR